MSENIRELDLETFDKLISTSDKFIAVMFYTTSCPNCQAIAPVYAELYNELKREALFTKVNAERNSILTTRFGVMGVPTFKFFCKHQPVGELVGAINTTLLRNTIKDLIRHRNECIGKSTRLTWELDGYG